jgi:TRAP-type C4-dicarboxylate transport system permease small subunit
MYTILKRINKIADKFAKFIVSLSFGTMTLLIFMQVIFRYVFKESLSWSEELARYLFIWLTFIGASIATREKSHINVAMFVNNLKSPKMKKTFIVLANLLSMFFLGVLVYYGFNIASQILKFKQVSASMPFLYVGFVYFAVPIGSLIMFLNLIEINLAVLKDEDEEDEGGLN